MSVIWQIILFQKVVDFWTAYLTFWNFDRCIGQNLDTLSFQVTFGTVQNVFDQSILGEELLPAPAAGGLQQIFTLILILRSIGMVVFEMLLQDQDGREGAVAKLTSALSDWRPLTFAGLVTNYCKLYSLWLFTINDHRKKWCLLQAHEQGLHHVVFTVFWDTRTSLLHSCFLPEAMRKARLRTLERLHVSSKGTSRVRNEGVAGRNNNLLLEDSIIVPPGESMIFTFTKVNTHK